MTLIFSHQVARGRRGSRRRAASPRTGPRVSPGAAPPGGAPSSTCASRVRRRRPTAGRMRTANRGSISTAVMEAGSRVVSVRVCEVCVRVCERCACSWPLRVQVCVCEVCVRVCQVCDSFRCVCMRYACTFGESVCVRGVCVCEVCVRMYLREVFGRT